MEKEKKVLTQNSDAPSLDENENFTKLSRKEVLTQNERIFFENENIVGSISLKGASIDDLVFKNYKIELDQKERVILLNPRKLQNGYYVERVFGWDTHGLPIEYEIEKKLGIKTKQQVIDFGIANYNEECRKIVLKFRNEWRTTIERLGRWVDFDNDYKTMDTSFMQSVWWVFWGII